MGHSCSVVPDSANEPQASWRSDDKTFRKKLCSYFKGVGVANGFIFRYPGSKPGSFFVIKWSSCFHLEGVRNCLDHAKTGLQELLKKSEWVPAPPLNANFSYLK
ncbi:conserved hypothetical protein [Ricinus communis]|uniref:Uncharacterized protein n=1 Tax=Ricinus communis TaxID=3988 RepID=B9RRG2_RICCO|nr:conserved hypothetical protein [Ricinus communis]